MVWESKYRGILYSYDYFGAVSVHSVSGGECVDCFLRGKHGDGICVICGGVSEDTKESETERMIKHIYGTDACFQKKRGGHLLPPVNLKDLLSCAKM